MEITRRTLLAAAGSSIALAGCLGSGGGSDGGDDDSTVQLRSSSDYGNILVDAGGMTLYMFDADTQGSGESACYDGCANAWPPLTVEGEPTAGQGVTAELTTFDRDDGTTQVAANGWPLYYFASDESPGDVNGQGVNDVWWVLAPNGAKVTEAQAPSGPGY